MDSVKLLRKMLRRELSERKKKRKSVKNLRKLETQHSNKETLKQL